MYELQKSFCSLTPMFLNGNLLLLPSMHIWHFCVFILQFFKFLLPFCFLDGPSLHHWNVRIFCTIDFLRVVSRLSHMPFHSSFVDDILLLGAWLMPLCALGCFWFCNLLDYNMTLCSFSTILLTGSRLAVSSGTYNISLTFINFNPLPILTLSLTVSLALIVSCYWQ